MGIRSGRLCLLVMSIALAACNSGESGTAKAGGGVMPVALGPLSEIEVFGSVSHGIDVSHYQGTIDWPAVRAAGKDFAFIRVSDGANTLDTEFAANWANAKSAGVARGVYQFFRASEDPTAQANLLLQKMGPLEPGDIPPTLDVEVMDGQTAATVRAKIATWISVIQPAVGRLPLIYTSPGFWSGLSAGQEPTTLWVAHWGVTNPTLPGSWPDWTFWQYSDTGTVAGISGAVDLDQFHGALEDLREYQSTGP